MAFCSAGYRVSGPQQNKVETSQGHRFEPVRLHDVFAEALLVIFLHIQGRFTVTTAVALYLSTDSSHMQDTILLDPYARAVRLRGHYGLETPVSSSILS